MNKTKKIIFTTIALFAGVIALSGCDTTTNGETSNSLTNNTSISSNTTTTNINSSNTDTKELTEKEFLEMLNYDNNYNCYSSIHTMYINDISEDNIMSITNIKKNGDWIYVHSSSFQSGKIYDYYVYEYIDNDKKEVIQFYYDKDNDSIIKTQTAAIDTSISVDTNNLREQIFNKLEYNENEKIYTATGVEFSTSGVIGESTYTINTICDYEYKIYDNKITYQKTISHKTESQDNKTITISEIGYAEEDLIIPNCITDYFKN